MKLIRNALTLFIIAALAVIVFHGKPEQQTARDLREDDLFCMVQAVYHESRGENAGDERETHGWVPSERCQRVIFKWRGPP